jgi:hypothetical protein
MIIVRKYLYFFKNYDKFISPELVILDNIIACKYSKLDKIL